MSKRFVKITRGKVIILLPLDCIELVEFFDEEDRSGYTGYALKDGTKYFFTDHPDTIINQLN